MADLVENEPRPIAVLQAGVMDDHPQRQTLDIHERMQLAASYLLAGVINDCVLFAPARGAPFSAAFSV